MNFLGIKKVFSETSSLNNTENNNEEVNLVEIQSNHSFKSLNSNNQSHRSINSKVSLSNLISKPDTYQNSYIQSLPKEKIEKLLGALSNVKQSSKINNKPLWVESVKNVHKQVVPSIELSDVENFNIYEGLKKDEFEPNEENFYRNNHPFYQGLKKLLFAFGDHKKPNSETVYYLHNSFKQMITLLMRILDKCDLLKIIEHLYSKEFKDFSSFKNSKITKKIKCLEGLNFSVSESDDSNSFSFSEDVNTIDNNEFLEFENHRSSLLTNEEYLESNDAKNNFFGYKSKKPFLKYLIFICEKENIIFSPELKQNNNLELLVFTIKKKLKSVIIAGNKKRNNDELKIISEPLLKADIQEFIEDEIQYLTDFINDFSESFYLIDAFSRKKTLSGVNKLVKITRDSGRLCIVIKKLCHLTLIESNFLIKARPQADKKFIKYFKGKEFYSYKIKEEKVYKYILTKEKILKDSLVENYYDYYLLTFFLEGFLYTNEFVIKKNIIQKLDKKYLDKRYCDYCNLDNFERNNIKEQFCFFK